MIMVEQRSGTREALVEMELLLRAGATSSPHRLAAVSYTRYRDVLLSSDLRGALPGFLIQCVSIFKFHDFINLYHPRGEARVAFVQGAFDDCKAMLDVSQKSGVFSDFDF